MSGRRSPGRNLGANYSKWDRLDVSDDEDTFHPHLDKTLNIRVNRISRDTKEDDIDEAKKKAIAKGDHAKASKIESRRPLHVGNVCRVAEERTIIHSADDPAAPGEDNFSADEYTAFRAEHQALFDRYAEASWEQSRAMLLEHGSILMDEYANSYYMLQALEEEFRGNTPQMIKLCRQGQIISQIHQFAELMKRPPRDLVRKFFHSFEKKNAKRAFNDSVDHFVKNIKQRVIDKTKEQEAEDAEAAKKVAEMKNPQKLPLVQAMYQMDPKDRLGPGGLDPVEVFDNLPEQMQQCFKTGDIELLKLVAAAMDQKKFERHFQRCIDSGLWREG